ncbi:ATP-binding protein [Actinomadura flavalba]|uniref:ATP-binding protein n=1 Tax=Actinomadura flavalba TaxID=1120938 RepID=UPI000360BC3B|nr:ATP-binding protein [Actinomadura flavalba]
MVVTFGVAPEPLGWVEPLRLLEPVGDLRFLRRAVGRWVGAWCGSLVAERAAWAVSELAGNAVRHGGGLAAVRVYPAAAGLVVEVCDGAAGVLPVLGRLDDVLAESGRGLAMLAAVAVDLGWSSGVSEKSVWVVLDAADMTGAV